jgi:hypothetical protein
MGFLTQASYAMAALIGLGIWAWASLLSAGFFWVGALRQRLEAET